MTGDQMFDAVMDCLYTALQENPDPQIRLQRFVDLTADLALRNHLITAEGYDRLVARYGPAPDGEAAA